jgi:OOP family OmpA-OmpF porin
MYKDEKEFVFEYDKGEFIQYYYDYRFKFNSVESLVELFKKQARNRGILVHTIPSFYTSQRCSCCGVIDKSKLATDIELALRDVLFNFNKATVRPESNSKLDLAAQIIKSSQGGTYLLIGHTDKKGTDAYNLALSRARAAEVVKELEKRGVDPSQIKSKGVGEAEAKVAETASDEERLQDRKVQVKYVLDSEWNSIPKNDIPTKLIIKK